MVQCNVYCTHIKCLYSMLFIHWLFFFSFQVNWQICYWDAYCINEGGHKSRIVCLWKCSSSRQNSLEMRDVKELLLIEMTSRKVCRFLNVYEDYRPGLFKNTGKVIGNRQTVPLLSRKTIEERLWKLSRCGIDVNYNNNEGKTWISGRNEWFVCYL